MPLTDFASYAAIRAALGVGAKELPDTVLADDLYLYALKSELRGVSATLAADYTIAKAEVTPPAITTNFVEATVLFAVYSVASQCASVLENIAPKSLTDGKAGFSRDSRGNTSETLASKRDVYRRNLQETFSSYKSVPLAVQVQFGMVSVSIPDYDPVTGL